MSADRPTVFAPALEEERGRPHFRCRGTTLGPPIEAERLGASMYEVDRGESSAPCRHRRDAVELWDGEPPPPAG